MAWYSSGTPGDADWRLQSNRLQVVNRSIDYLYTLSYATASYNWKNNKQYRFCTDTLDIWDNSGSFSVTTNWNDTLEYTLGTTPSNVSPGSTSTQSFYLYSSPQASVSSPYYLTYRANGTFSNAGTSKNRGIVDINVTELDFIIQGFSYYKLKNEELNNVNNSLGWYYDVTDDLHLWYDRSGTSSLSLKNLYPVGGSNGYKTSHVAYRLNNYIGKFIPYSYFNISFQYLNDNDFPLEIYLSPELPTPDAAGDLITGILDAPINSIKISSLTHSGPSASLGYTTPVEFYGLKGNQYIYFKGAYTGDEVTGATYCKTFIKNIKIDGGYNDGNNKQYLINYGSTQSSLVSQLTNATYSSIVGYGDTVSGSTNNLSNVFSKIGNGKFLSGIWENGVWNSGWREDEIMQEFYSVYLFVGYEKQKRWRVELQGPTASVSNFNIGDNVSIGNIISIDINENRNILKNYFTIIGKTGTSIIVEFDNNFPLRRIEKDSINHRIYVTKNVWLSGGFFNGYFTGVWNYGLFKGYPMITEMYNTHWIDGIFDGGHFKTDLYQIPNFIDTFYNNGKVGLSFSATESHGLIVGDIITINKSNKTINPQYDGETTVTSVIDSNNIVTNLDWGNNSTMEGGEITTEISKGLIQKSTIKSNNTSTITSNTSLYSYSVFSYNSWIDVNYTDTSATNIGKPQNLLNSTSRKQYSENNLYGYITNDILDSNSTFRDSFSISEREYRLGTKYKIFNDFIGDSGNFENYFYDNSDFIDMGWSYSIYNNGSLTFSRTDDNGIPGILGEELNVKATGLGGVLDINTSYNGTDILNKTYGEIQKSRYTKIEFDVITYSTIIASYSTSTIPFFGINISVTDHRPYEFIKFFSSGLIFSYIDIPHIHFDNLNFTNRPYGITISTTYLPIYKNVNHLKTNKKKKMEYFYNKKNLSMNFLGYTYLNNGQHNTTEVEYIIDNLHFYEVDMIPFFQYFTDESINKGIQIPYQGISPFIDYTNSNFKFIDNISIGLDSIQTVNSNTAISGVGVGIGINSGTSSNDSIFIADAEQFQYYYGKIIS